MNFAAFARTLHSMTPKRLAELLILICFIAVVTWALRPEPPTIIWVKPSPPEEQEVETRKRMMLKPNLERSPEVFNRDLISVDGVRLGMTFGEVAETLGEVEEIEGFIPKHYFAEFRSLDVEWGPTRVEFSENSVISVRGCSVQMRGQELSTAGQGVDLLTESLGPSDHRHAAGYGGTPVYCWTAKDIVLEVWGGIYIADPNHHPENPHLWFTGCGGVGEDFYEMVPVDPTD